jgi:methionyl-tRNA formyltransferase
LKILQAAVEPGCGAPGTVLAAEAAGPLIACGAQALRLQQVQPPGKKPMSGSDFLNGFQLLPGVRLSAGPEGCGN